MFCLLSLFKSDRTIYVKSSVANSWQSRLMGGGRDAPWAFISLMIHCNLSAKSTIAVGPCEKKLVKSALFDCDRHRSVSAAGINAGINRDKIESARCDEVGREAAGVARGGWWCGLKPRVHGNLLYVMRPSRYAAAWGMKSRGGGRKNQWRTRSDRG